MTKTAELAKLAALAGLSPRDAIALPTVIEVSASKMGMSELSFIREALVNEPLRAYLAGICAIGAEAL